MAVKIDDDIDLYLDATASLHNGINSKKFGTYLQKLGTREGFMRYTKKGFSELMGVSRTTLDDYIARYNKKHGKTDDDATV